jgi:glycosyltransferase involved in cell wall biosynthesis
MQLDVIVPVGPGHEELMHHAMESVRVATAMRHPFEAVRLRVVDDRQGLAGRSAARNQAVRESTADWLFFLDADDAMHPEALVNVEPYLATHDAIWGMVLEWDGHLAQWRYQVPRIETLEVLVAYDPFLTLGPMGHFVRREVATANPFDEDMDCGEDWDYYLRLWRGYRCIKQEGPLILNYRGQHSTGPRSATGKQWGEVVRPMIEAERQRLKAPAVAA